jgi:ribosomal protein S10
MSDKTNSDKTPDISSLLKNLENIKSEFLTLREYVGGNTDELKEKISNVVETLSRSDASSAEFHNKADSIIQELQKMRNATNRASSTTSNEVIGLLKLAEYQSNIRMQSESKYGSLEDIEKMAQQTAEIVNIFDKLSIESENKIPLPSEVRRWAVSTIFDCADRWEIRFVDVFNRLLESLGKNLLKESIRIQQVRDIFGTRGVDQIKNELGLS